MFSFKSNKEADFRVMWANSDCVPTCNRTAVCAAGLVDIPVIVAGNILRMLLNLGASSAMLTSRA